MGTILVTGANRGIGLELACQYAEAGERVIATCRDLGVANALEHLRASHPGVELQEMDACDDVSIHSLASLLRKRGDALDVIINNAGVLQDEPFGSFTMGAFNRAFATNVTGPALVTQAMASLIVSGGKIINMSSGIGSFEMGISVGGGAVSYAASKAALNMVTVHCAAALKEKGITVVAMSPGWVKTDMGGQEAELAVQESVESLRRAIAGLSLQKTGSFFDYSGEQLPW